MAEPCNDGSIKFGHHDVGSVASQPVSSPGHAGLILRPLTFNGSGRRP